MNETDWTLIQELQKGIPLCETPFQEIGRRCGLTEDEVLGRVQAFCDTGIIRRLGARIAHMQVGIGGNVMVAWQVPEEDLERVGQALARRPEISHCYQRRSAPNCPYNLYTMIHASSAEQAATYVEEISQAVEVADFVSLPTVKELKKTSPVYVPPGESR